MVRLTESLSLVRDHVLPDTRIVQLTVRGTQILRGSPKSTPLPSKAASLSPKRAPSRSGEDGGLPKWRPLERSQRPFIAVHDVVEILRRVRRGQDTMQGTGRHHQHSLRPHGGGECVVGA